MTTQIIGIESPIEPPGNYQMVNALDQTRNRPLSAAVADLFSGPVVTCIPPIADRHDYKKKSGNSDTYNTYDAIET
jgi:hypothetical protein